MKKWLVWCIPIIGAIALLVILAFTLFGLNGVTIKLENKSNKFSSEKTQEEIINSADFVKHSCVFFLDKQAHANKIEKEYPFIKVINIEIIFPNNLVVHCIERESYFSITANEKTYVCDNELKILEIKDNIAFESTQDNEIFLTGLTFQDKYFAGDTIESEDFADVITAFSPAFSLNNRDIAEQKALVKKICVKKETSIVSGVDTPTIVFWDFCGIPAIIKDSHQFLEEKIKMYFSTQEKAQEKMSAGETIDTILICHIMPDEKVEIVGKVESHQEAS